MSTSIGIGSKVWLEKGDVRSHDRKAEKVIIDGETSRSWLLFAGTYREIKIPKSLPSGMHTVKHTIGSDTHVWTTAEARQNSLIRNQSWQIEKAVGRATPDQLRQIMTVLGMPLPEAE